MKGRWGKSELEVHRQCFGRLSAPNNRPITDCLVQDASSFGKLIPFIILCKLVHKNSKQWDGGHGTIFEIE